MPKRRNPFGDCSPLQFKNRIGTKEVDLGVCSGEKMKTVYENTKSLMFQGARRPTIPQHASLQMECTSEPIVPLPGQLRLDTGGNLCGYQDQPMETQASEPFKMCKPIHSFFNNNNYSKPTVPLKNGQMQINPQGQLTAGVKAKPCSFQGAGLLPSQCHSCTRFNGTLQGCSFCEKRTCTDCIRQCYQCLNNFCQVCSVLNYDDCTERSFCLQCSP